jgi:L-Ala-D/L-Glu epimerase
MKLELRRMAVASPGAGDARRAWSTRESLVVRLGDSSGNCGWGEASPLPGYSPDNLLDAEAALASLDTSALSQLLEPARSTPRDALAAVAALLPLSMPSARMAIETAALDLLGRRAQLSAPALLGAALDSERDLAQLVGTAGSDSLLATAARARQEGFRYLKLKLGAAGQLERELDGVVRLREACGRDVTLRLDANGALAPAAIERAWRALAPLDIEMFEEPGNLPTELRGLIPLALDESLQGRTASEAQSLLMGQRPRFIVLKPMALGGLTHCLELAEVALQLGVSPVLSHCFDGPLAFRATAALALLLEARTAHGLAPHAGLAAFRHHTLPVHRARLRSWTEPGLASGEEPWA